MSVTVKDVARKAGVSVMTISRVVNNSGYVAEATRAKVMAAVKALGYRQNKTARSLSRRKSDVISIMVPDISNPFFSGIVRAAERVARLKGYHVILGDSEGVVANEYSFMETTAGRMSDGLILAAPRMKDNEIRTLSAMVPLVVVDTHVHSPDVIDVYVDNKAGAQEAVEYLIAHRHRRIGFIGGPHGVWNSRRRRNGFESALAAHKIPLAPELVFEGGFLFEDGIAACDYFLDLADPPTAVFSSNDLMAVGLIQRARQRGLSVPEDLSVVGFDDIPLASYITPALTTVRHPMFEMGRRAVELLLAQLNSSEVVSERGTLKNSFVERSSVTMCRSKRRRNG